MLKQRIYEFLELSIPGDRFGFVFDRFMMILIALNVFAIILETVPSIHAAYTGFFFGFEIFSVTIFTTEYILRLWSCTENKVDGYTHPILGRIKFMFSPMAIIDLIAFLPFLPQRLLCHRSTLTAHLPAVTIAQTYPLFTSTDGDLGGNQKPVAGPNGSLLCHVDGLAFHVLNYLSI